MWYLQALDSCLSRETYNHHLWNENISMQAINQQVVAQQLLPWAQGGTGWGTQRIPMANFEDLSWAAQGAVVKRAQYSSPRMVGDKWFCWWAAQDRQHGANMEHRWKCGSVLKLGHVPKDFMPNPVHCNSSFLEGRWPHWLQWPADTDLESPCSLCKAPNC